MTDDFTQRIIAFTRMADQFRATKTSDGQLAYPQFDAVYKKMGALMKSDPTLASMSDGPEKMEAAYAIAIQDGEGA